MKIECSRRTSQMLVDDLQALLRNAGIPGPYVMVGWSLGGGFNGQLLARQDEAAPSSAW